MQSDKELLMLAAKAAGLPVHESTDGTLQARPILALTHYVMGQPYGEYEWNPLRGDADAFRLAAKLMMSVEISEHEESTYAYAGKVPRVYACEMWRGDKEAATRRAITRAAASLAQQGVSE